LEEAHWSSRRYQGTLRRRRSEAPAERKSASVSNSGTTRCVKASCGMRPFSRATCGVKKAY
jgi:hypothetical protein